METLFTFVNEHFFLFWALVIYVLVCVLSAHHLYKKEIRKMYDSKLERAIAYTLTQLGIIGFGWLFALISFNSFFRKLIQLRRR